MNYKITDRARNIHLLSTKQLYDENGNPHLCVDEGLRRRLETKLITKILAFKVAQPIACAEACPFSHAPAQAFVLPFCKSKSAVGELLQTDKIVLFVKSNSGQGTSGGLFLRLFCFADSFCGEL